MYGDWQVGALSAEEYTREAVRWARAIRMLDPSAKLVSCGWDGLSAWDSQVIDETVSVVDLHSIHLYTGSHDYWTNVLQPHHAERAIRCTRALIERAAHLQQVKNPPRIAYDEWNVWFRTQDGALEERYNFSDALAVATYLNIFVRNCAWVHMANLAQMVNAIAPIVTTPEVAVVQPTYYPFLLHSQSALDVAVDVHIEGPKIDGPGPEETSRWPHGVDDLAPFDLVDASATVDRARHKLSVTVVNRRQDAPEPLEIVLRNMAFQREARIRVVTAEKDTSARTVPDVESVGMAESSEAAKGSELLVLLPPQSFSVIEVEMTKE
jgi:alpha-N-arabinofuranosidase